MQARFPISLPGGGSMAKRVKPALVRVQIAGTGEVKTVRADDIQPGQTPFHAALTDEQKAVAERLYWRIGKLARPDQTIAQWVDRFRFDQHPDTELAHWQAIGQTFELFGGKAKR